MRIVALLPPLEREAMAIERLACDVPGVSVIATSDPAEAAAHLSDAEALVTIGPMLTDPAIDAALASAGALRWIQSIGTGVDHMLGRPGVAVSNVRGIHGAQMSEAAIGAMLALARDLPRAVRQQGERRWDRYVPRRLAGSVVGILGVGAIAEALAPRLGALGMTVVGISGSPRPMPGFDRMAARDDLAGVVADLDWLVLLTPLTAATRHIVDARVLAGMKPTACLVNLARGGVVDEAALLAALDQGGIAGAALDVFAHEPLAADSAFWRHPRVIVTPHVGGIHAGYPDEVYAIVADNVRRYRAGGAAAPRQPRRPGGRMNVAPDPRVNTPIPTRELERRWAATRAAMERAGIDVLICQANQDFMGGYPKWLTDLPATQGYAEIVVFPRDAGMTLIGQGPFGLDRQVPPEGDGVRRGVDRFLSAPMYASAGYTHAYDAELTLKALAPYARATIGLVGLSTLSWHLVDTLKRQLSAATFVDASDMVDRIKAIKSEDEIAVIRAVAGMQDRAMEAAFAAFRPGARDRDVTAAAEFLSLGEGSEQGLYMCASSPAGEGIQFRNRHFQDRVIEPGDQMALLIENAGAGGYYCELGRTAVLGLIPDTMVRGLELMKAARAFMLERLRPGGVCADIWHDYNTWMRDHGLPEEDRLHCHSMGYDLVERPLVRFDEPMPLAANMVVSCHPTWFDTGGLHWLCDNYLIGEFATERLHAFPQDIVVIE